jgi:hypothetical protein
MYNTLWMVGTGGGATMQDLLIKNEMTKPWAAIGSYWRRHHTVGFWAWRSIGRLFLCLGISVSVLLLGASLNTIAWPKQRWYPNRDTMNLTGHRTEEFTIHTPLQSLERIDWDQDVRDGRNLVGDVLDVFHSTNDTGGAADEIAGAISASTALLVLTRLPALYNRSLKDWQGTWPLVVPDVRYPQTTYMTGIQTQTNESTVQSLSVQSQTIAELFRYHQHHRKSFARTAIGFHGIFQMTKPALRTVCGDLTAGDVQENDVDIRVIDGSASFSVHIGRSTGLSFAGVTCTLTFVQALVPVEAWITDLMVPPWTGISNITAPASLQPLPIDTASADTLIATSLATHFRAMTPKLQGMVPTFGLVPHLILTARTLQAPGLDFGSDAAAMSAVIAILAQQQLSTALWTFRVHEDHLIASWPVCWQLYGSGPRLTWEWIAIAVLGIIFLVTINHIGLLLGYRIQPGLWLDLSGMLQVAYGTCEPLPAVDKLLLKPSPHAQQERAKEFDDEIRFKIKVGDNNWPVLVECASSGAPMSMSARCRHSQQLRQRAPPSAPQTTPENGNNIRATEHRAPSVIPGASGPALASVSPSISARVTPLIVRTPSEEFD